MSRTRRRLTISLATLLLVSVIPVAVMAAGGAFTDDDTSIFEADIEWLADAGVTRGCNPPDNTLFCPESNVTREQMAAFMKRFAEYLGAGDGVVSEADHATDADHAASADHALAADSALAAGQADNARTVGGKYATELQPSTFAFSGGNDFHHTTAGTHTLATASVTTTDGSGWVCRVGQTPKSFINVRASGYSNLVDASEGGWLQLSVNGTLIDGSRRYFKNVDGSYATEWIHTSTGGTDTFRFQVFDGNSHDYYLLNNNLTVEVLQETKCTSLVIAAAETPDMDGMIEE